MSFSDELDMLVDDCHEILGHQTITIRRNYPGTSELDPVTMGRPSVLGAEQVRAICGESTRVPHQNGGGFTTRKTFSVRAADLTFRPTRGNTVIEPDPVITAGIEWKVLTVTEEVDSRSWDLSCERMG